jgi:hypothetical protein
MGMGSTTSPVEFERKKVKYGKVVPVHAMKRTRKIQVELHSFITKALDDNDWSPSLPDTFTPRKEHWD